MFDDNIILSYYYCCTVLYCCIGLYSIERDWPPCKVGFRVGNQNTKCDKDFVCCYMSTGMHRASSVVVLIVVFTRAPDAGAWGPPVLRGECEEVFVFELSGTHELYTINTTYEVATT